MTKIVFDLEEFRGFLKELDETDYAYGCRSPIDWDVVSRYFDEADGYLKTRRVCHMLDGSVETDDDWDKVVNIKGVIINE